MSDHRYIGGRAARCLRCKRISTMHHTVRVGECKWCNYCQDTMPCETWVYLSGDVDSHACADPGPSGLDCSLPLKHVGGHRDNITGETWGARSR